MDDALEAQIVGMIAKQLDNDIHTAAGAQMIESRWEPHPESGPASYLDGEWRGRNDSLRFPGSRLAEERHGRIAL